MCNRAKYIVSIASPYFVDLKKKEIIFALCVLLERSYIWVLKWGTSRCGRTASCIFITLRISQLQTHTWTDELYRQAALGISRLFSIHNIFFSLSLDPWEESWKNKRHRGSDSTTAVQQPVSSIPLLPLSMRLHSLTLLDSGWSS